MKKKYSLNELKKRIYCVTDAKKGALLQIAQREGYQTFVIPDDVGGRFSIFTPVGLVPLAFAGVDIISMVEGARKGQQEYSQLNLEKNSSYQYAANRFLLYKKGKAIEVLASFYDNMLYVAEWWKQLFGESEGKDGKGIFPASVIYSADLHSLGQLLQDGQRNIFETFFRANNATTIQGTGLGLNIVKRYLDLMGGRVTFVSQENVGTTFTVTVPLEKL
jgi:glucose-6-phosphate isomerase